MSYSARFSLTLLVIQGEAVGASIKDVFDQPMGPAISETPFTLRWTSLPLWTSAFSRFEIPHQILTAQTRGNSNKQNKIPIFIRSVHIFSYCFTQSTHKHFTNITIELLSLKHLLEQSDHSAEIWPLKQRTTAMSKTILFIMADQFFKVKVSFFFELNKFWSAVRLLYGFYAYNLTTFRITRPDMSGLVLVGVIEILMSDWEGKAIILFFQKILVTMQGKSKSDSFSTSLHYFYA